MKTRGKRTIKKNLIAIPILLFGILMCTGLTGCISSPAGSPEPRTKASGKYKGPKLRIGIASFQNESPVDILGVEGAAADIFEKTFQDTDRFVVVPHQNLDSIMSEQSFSNYSTADISAAKIGQALGLNAIVMGIVTAYYEHESGEDYFVYSDKRQISKATINYRIVDADSGTQIMADSSVGLYERKGGGVPRPSEKRSYDDSDLRDGALRDSLVKAMEKILIKLSAREWSGRVASTKGATVYLNAGRKTGLKVGDILLVYDPGTATVAGKVKGKIEVTGFFGSDASVAAARSGSGIRINDIVKLER